MMNLFEGVRKMTDDEIRMQIALFRNVTLLNAAKETSGKVLGGRKASAKERRLIFR